MVIPGAGGKINYFNFPYDDLTLYIETFTLRIPSWSEAKNMTKYISKITIITLITESVETLSLFREATHLNALRNPLYYLWLFLVVWIMDDFVFEPIFIFLIIL